MKLKFTTRNRVFYVLIDTEGINHESPVIDIIKLLEEKKFDYLRKTYIPSQEDKILIYKLYEKKINQGLLQREKDVVETLIEEGWPIKEILWHDQKLVLLLNYDSLLLKWIINYEEFYKSYKDKEHIYLDFYDKSKIKRISSEYEIKKVNQVLAETGTILFAELSDRTEINSVKLEEIISMYIDYGFILQVKENYVSLSDRGMRLFTSSYK